MRTKALLLTAAIGAAGIATSMAQVYSVNAVGYVNVAMPIPAGNQGQSVFALLANPLNGTNNVIGTILPAVPDGSVVYTWNGTFVSTSFTAGFGWDAPATVLAPGTGFFLAIDPAVAPTGATITFVGEVPQGNLTNNVPSNYSMKGSIVPQSGLISSTLGFVPSEFGDDLLHKYSVTTQQYDSYSYLGGGTWVPSQPTLGVGEGFFYFNSDSQSLAWGRSFNVN